MKKAQQALDDNLTGITDRYYAEFRMLNNAGEWQWILSRGKVLDFDESGKPLHIVGTIENITARKEAESALIKAKEEQGKIVLERTAELEEMNIALNVLLKKRDKDIAAYKEQLMDNFGILVEPYIIKLENSGLTSLQKQFAGIIRENFNELLSFLSVPTGIHLNKLSTMEIKVANLVKLGHPTKDIANILHLSPGTISSHRRNIRKKLKITNKKENLHSLLSSISHGSDG